jgi:hypothetical protein
MMKSTHTHTYTRYIAGNNAWRILAWCYIIHTRAYTFLVKCGYDLTESEVKNLLSL